MEQATLQQTEQKNKNKKQTNQKTRKKHNQPEELKKKNLTSRAPPLLKTYLAWYTFESKLSGTKRMVVDSTIRAITAWLGQQKTLLKRQKISR